MAAALVAVVGTVAVGVVVGVAFLPQDSPKASTTFPEGIYRYQLNAREVLQIIPVLPPDFVRDATGTFTWAFRKGSISLAQTGCKCDFSRVTGAYVVSAHSIVVHWPKLVSGGVQFCWGSCIDRLRWSFDGSALHLSPMSKSAEDIVFWGAGKPWVKIG